jgi:hypothetical protein
MTADAGAAAAAIAQAIKASGAIVKVDPDEFRRLLQRSREPLVAVSSEWLFGKRFRYLMGYKGLIFYTSSKEEISLPSSVEVVAVKRIWVPS